MIAHKDFVVAWVDSFKKGTGVPAVAKKLDITIAAALAKAGALRKQGVKLPNMPKTRQEYASVEDLNRLIDLKLT